MRSVLQGVDPTFEPPGLGRGSMSAAFANARGVRVDVLTPHRGSDDRMGAPLSMPALGGASAQPLRFMGFLIRSPIRSVVLHGPGIPVNVPAPERFAAHKLIISNRRNDDAVGVATSRKDLVQAGEIIQALVLADQRHVIGPAFDEAWGRGSEWRRLIERGAARLQPVYRGVMKDLGLPFAAPSGPSRHHAS